MAVNKNFVIKNGIEVADDLIFANSTLDKVGIGSTLPSTTLDIKGQGMRAEDGEFTGILTANSALVGGGNVTVNSTGVNVSGRVTATTFFGDGSNLSGIGNTQFVKTEQLFVVGVTTFGNGMATMTDTRLDITGGILASGIVTANTFHGTLWSSDLSGALPNINGSALSGIVTNLTAGTGINISGSTGAITISGTSDSINFWLDNDTGIHTLGSVGICTTNATGAADPNNSTILNAGIVTAVRYFGDASNMTGLPAGSIGIRSEAAGSVAFGVTFIDFRGAGVSTITTPSAGIATINITGGGSGGGGGTANNGGFGTAIPYADNTDAPFSVIDPIAFVTQNITFNDTNAGMDTAWVVTSSPTLQVQPGVTVTVGGNRVQIIDVLNLQP